MRRFCLTIAMFALPVFNLAVLALPAPALAQNAFTTDDLLRIEDLSQPVFAPDSASIVYVVTGPGDGDAFQSDLWRARWQGGADDQGAQAIEATLDRDEYSPAFSADGRVLAFIRSGGEGETAQLWVSEDGARARKVSDLPGGVDAFTLSPDGRQAVAVSEVGANVGVEHDVPPPVVVGRFLAREDGRGWLDDRRAHLHRIDLATGEAVQITTGDFDHWFPAWSPDGAWIAFASPRCEDRDRRFCSSIYIARPDGAGLRRISRSEAADADPNREAGGPQWSPDSRQLAWTRNGEERAIYYTPQQIVVADISSGAEREVAWIDRWFYYPRWSADGQLLALVEQDRDTWLARIDPASGAISYLTHGARFAYDFAAAPDGRIAVLDGDNLTPTALRSVEASPRTLSPHNRWVGTRQLAQTQDVSFLSDGVEIHALLTLPPGHQPGQRHPLIARLHGGPVYQFSHEFMADFQVFAAAGYAVLAINPRGSSGRGAAFAQAQMARWGTVDAADISAGITHVLGMGVADPDAIGVGGWSYGGILSNYMIASDPRVKAAVAGAGMANFLGGYGVDMYAREYEQELGLPWVETDRWLALSYPFFRAAEITAPTLYLCAEEDWNVPCSGSLQMYQALQAEGVPTGLVVYPGETHSLSVPSYLRDRIERSLAWYGRWLRD